MGSSTKYVAPVASRIPTINSSIVRSAGVPLELAAQPLELGGRSVERAGRGRRRHGRLGGSGPGPTVQRADQESRGDEDDERRDEIPGEVEAALRRRHQRLLPVLRDECVDD